MSNKEQLDVIKELRDALQTIRIRTIYVASMHGHDMKVNAIDSYDRVFELLDAVETMVIEKAVESGELVWKE